MSRLEDVLTLVSQKNTLHLYVITRGCSYPCFSKGYSHFMSHEHRMRTLGSQKDIRIFVCHY